MSAGDAAALLGAPPRGLTAVTVSAAVSSVRNDGPELIEPA